MKVAFDLHGVIDTYPDIICPMITLLYKMGNKICVVSGPGEFLIREQLQKIDFFNKCPEVSRFIPIYSVVEFLINSGVHTWKDKNGDVWADDQNWWDSKAKICQKEKVDYIIDDSEKYKSAFELIDCKFIHIDELI